MAKFHLWKKAKKDPERPFCTAVIVAAGSASRMQGVDKIMADLAGEPLICRTICVFQSCDAVQAIVIVTREDLAAPIQSLCKENGFDKVCAVTVGGETRTASVMKGLDCAPKETVLAAIHDGARPLVPLQVVQRTIQTAARTGAAAPGIPVKDTIKIAECSVIRETPPRDTLFAVQTPQVFDFDFLRGALQKALDSNIAITDDCSAVEALGMKVHLTEGSEENMKITTPLDLLLAEAVLEGREKR